MAHREMTNTGALLLLGALMLIGGFYLASILPHKIGPNWCMMAEYADGNQVKGIFKEPETMWGQFDKLPRVGLTRLQVSQCR